MAEERRRIARELHDLAGHTLAAVLLHVTGARHVLRRDVDEAERALLEAETSAGRASTRSATTVAALRTNERGTDRRWPGPPTSPPWSTSTAAPASTSTPFTAAGPPSTARSARRCTASPGRRWPTWPATHPANSVELTVERSTPRPTRSGSSSPTTAARRRRRSRAAATSGWSA